MKPVFTDTAYFVALLNPADRWHRLATGANRDSVRGLLTTEWILTEVGNALKRGPGRERFGRLLRILSESPATEIVSAESALFRRGCELFLSHSDKEGSLTDCISFVIMRERGLSEALTSDHHFEQAGFQILLKD